MPAGSDLRIMAYKRESAPLEFLSLPAPSHDREEYLATARGYFMIFIYRTGSNLGFYAILSLSLLSTSFSWTQEQMFQGGKRAWRQLSAVSRQSLRDGTHTSGHGRHGRRRLAN